MKVSIKLFILAFVLFAVGCGDAADSTEQASSTSAPADMAEEANQEAPASSNPVADVAVCLWDQAGLREKPGRGKDNKYLATINFGEVVRLTGEAQEVSSEKRTYVEVELSDGKIGWVSDYLFSLQSERAAGMKEIEVYKRPELSTFTGKSFQLGDIFAVKPTDKEGWVEVAGFERKVSGWARVVEGAYSVEEVDVTVAVLLQRAMNESDLLKREEALSQIASNSTFQTSPLISKIDEALASSQSRQELPANQLYIAADKLNVRSAPDNEAENVIFQLAANDICTIIERGEKVAIRDMTDYWYKIEKDGQEGWIFGYFTSKRLEE